MKLLFLMLLAMSLSLTAMAQHKIKKQPETKSSSLVLQHNKKSSTCMPNDNNLYRKKLKHKRRTSIYRGGGPFCKIVLLDKNDKPLETSENIRLSILDDGDFMLKGNRLKHKKRTSIYRGNGGVGCEIVLQEDNAQGSKKEKKVRYKHKKSNSEIIFEIH